MVECQDERSQHKNKARAMSLLQARIEQFEPGRYWVAKKGNDAAGVVFQSPVHFFATITPEPEDTAERFLQQLKLKAGLAPDHWSDNMRAWRYSTECFGGDNGRGARASTG